MRLGFIAWRSLLNNTTYFLNFKGTFHATCKKYKELTLTNQAQYLENTVLTQLLENIQAQCDLCDSYNCMHFLSVNYIISDFR